MRAFAAFALLIVMACTPVAPAPSASDPGQSAPAVPVHEMSAAQCEAAGGDMQRVCRMGSIQCVVTYADAGRTCRDGDDCQGDCRADVGTPSGTPVTGRCQATSDPCGCFANVEDGQVDGALCVD